MVTSNAYVLILAPIGRDGAVAEKILAEVGYTFARLCLAPHGVF